MTVAWIQPFSGIAGDMTVAALLDLGMPLDALRAVLERLPLRGYTLRTERVERGPFAATRFVVESDEDHPHRSLRDVEEIIGAGGLPERVAERSRRAFRLLAEAEGAVHGIAPEEVHFHEVGAVDAIVDIVGAAVGFEHFGVDRIVASRVLLGTGEVECRHGVIPVPGPATLRLLRGFPVRLSEGEGETTTPTGAAILAAFAEPLVAEAGVAGRTGIGAGTRDGESRPNVLRVSLLAPAVPQGERDEVVELAANLDDMSPEITAHAAARLMAEGALDAWLTPVLMKKGRPGTVLTVLAREEDAGRLEAVLFRETTTLGVRRAGRSRTVLLRRIVEARTEWGVVRVKEGILDGAVVTRAPEYEDCARVAAAAGVPLRAVYEAALKGGA